MAAELKVVQVGPWLMNSYLIVCGETGASAVVDPGGDAEVILENARGRKIEKILLTHGHGDHIGALAEVKEKTGAPVFLHPADAEIFGVSYDIPLADGDILSVGNLRLKVMHTPGHTPGSICLDLGDGRIIVGDTLFVGGPGATGSSQAFALTMQNMENIFFTWSDETRFFPGHGSSGRIGDERLDFEAFLKRGWSADLCGDVTWA
jgi:hydroxyacylglutathione hydrolase